MSFKRILLFVVLADFLGLTGYAVYHHGYVSFFDELLSSSVGIAAFADLTIALSLIALWMIGDARERGVSALPYLVLTLALGSVGPLLYLLRYTPNESDARPRLAPQAG